MHITILDNFWILFPTIQGTTVVVSKYVYSIVIKEAVMLAALSMSYVATWVSRKSKITCLVS